MKTHGHLTRVMQTTFGDSNDPDKANRGDCFPACVASLLGLPDATSVPRWYGIDSLDDETANWWAIVEWLQARDATIVCWDLPLNAHMARTLKGLHVIVSGQSPRYEGLHAVIGQVQPDGSIAFVHDPHPSGDFVVGAPGAIELVARIAAASQTMTHAEEGDEAARRG